MSKKLFYIFSYLTVALLLGVAVSFAGTLTPPGSPSKTMKSLSDLYQLINTGANTPSTDFTTPGTVSETMHSLGDTYDLLKTKITAIDGTKILTGTSIFGVGGSATPAPTAPVWATADVSSYDCSWFTSMTDSTQNPSPTSAQICGYNTGDLNHAGCSWNAGTSQCDGGVKSTEESYITWYAAKAACANSTEGGQTAGTWRLPTYPELAQYYLGNNGSHPNFLTEYYWTGSTLPPFPSYAYDIRLLYGLSYFELKSDKFSYAHCVR